MVSRPHILISNDDGIHAPGIAALSTMLRTIGDVTVVAPEGARSGASSQITSSLPLKLTKMEEEEGYRVYRCTGTPADCVKLALNVLFSKECRPDLVVTGINHGRNDGICVVYSGTVGAALEGCIAEMRYAVAYTESLVRWMLSNKIPTHTMLSLNLPSTTPLGFKVAPQAVGRFRDEFLESTNGSGGRVYWMVGSQVKTEDEPNTDWDLLEEGYATLTPIRIDMTDRDFLPHLYEAFRDGLPE